MPLIIITAGPVLLAGLAAASRILAGRGYRHHDRTAAAAAEEGK